MTVMRWFRRHNKKLLVGIVFLLMLAFGLPTVFFTASGKRSPGKEAVAYIRDEQGVKQAVTQGMMQSAERDLRVLRAIGMDSFSLQGWIGSIPSFQGVGSYTALASHLLFFGESRLSRGLRDMLYQQALQSDWASDEETLAELRETINQLAGAEPSQAHRYYYLLQEEAHRAGIEAGPEQIEAVLKILRQKGMRLGTIINQLHVTEEDVEAAIGNYLAIIRYGDMMSKPLALSEGELKKNIRDRIQFDKVTGTFVAFKADLYRDKMGEPSEGDLQGQFERYKKYRRGEAAGENPYGFGYFLDDRVEVEYLRVDMTEAQKCVEAEFAPLSARQQEELIKQFWSENRLMFREQITPEGAEKSEPQYRNLEFDEVADLAWSMRQQQEAQKKAEQLLTEAKKLSREVWSGAALKELSLTERAAKAADYAVIALNPKVSTESLKVSAGKSDYLGPEAAGESEWGRAYQLRKNAPGRALLDILFNCKPLHKGIVSNLDEPPVELYEDIGPVFTFSAEDKGVAAFLVRIVGVDPAREPVSPADDGRGGPADKAGVQTNQSELYERVKNDWKTLQAYELAKKQAQMFAQQAGSDWVGALAEANRSLIKEPNQAPGGDPLRQESLESIRQIRNDYLQLVRSEQGRQMAPFISSQIGRVTNIIQQAMERARQRGETEEQGPAVLSCDKNLSCLVFESLSVTLPTEKEYLRYKPITARELIGRNQELMALLFFNPGNIEKRAGFELRTY